MGIYDDRIYDDSIYDDLGAAFGGAGAVLSPFTGGISGLIGGGLGTFFGALGQGERQRRARQLQRLAIQRFKRLGPVVADFSRGADLDVGDRRALAAFRNALARGNRTAIAQLANRGLRGGARTQAFTDLQRGAAERVGELGQRLESTRPTRKARRLGALTDFQQKLAQLENAQATALSQQPSGAAQIAGAATNLGLRLQALDQFRQMLATSQGRPAEKPAGKPAGTGPVGGVVPGIAPGVTGRGSFIAPGAGGASPASAGFPFQQAVQAFEGTLSPQPGAEALFKEFGIPLGQQQALLAELGISDISQIGSEQVRQLRAMLLARQVGSFFSNIGPR